MPSKNAVTNTLSSSVSALLLVGLLAVGCTSPPPAQDASRGSSGRGALAKVDARNLESSEGDWRHSLRTGEELASAQRDVDAMLHLLRAHIESGGNAETRSAIAWLQLRHDSRVSVALFSDLVREDAANATAWHGLGLARLRLGEYEKANVALERSLALKPGRVEVLTALSSVNASIGDFNAAIRYASEASALDPADGAAANALGYSLMLHGELERAESALTRAVETDPNNGTFLNNLGVCFVLLEKPGEALELFARSGEKQSAYNNLGFLLVGQGDFARGVSLLEKALADGGPADRVVLENLRRAAEL